MPIYKMVYFLIITCLLVGYTIGLVQKGVTVNINHKNSEIPTKYNDSLASELPLAVQQYYHQNNGFNNF